MSIEEYRQEILSILLNVKNKKGEPRFDEASAKELLRQLSDEELGKVCSLIRLKTWLKCYPRWGNSDSYDCKGAVRLIFMLCY